MIGAIDMVSDGFGRVPMEFVVEEKAWRLGRGLGRGPGAAI